MFWIILSWVFVFLLTGINIFVFLKMKKAAQQMMQMTFPGVRNMGEAMSKVQQMMGSMNKMSANKPQLDTQMKAAMQLFQNMQKKK